MFISLLQQKILMRLGNKKMTRGELVAILGVPRTTLYDNLRKLYKIGYVDRTEVSNGKRGRPLVYWELLDFYSRGSAYHTFEGPTNDIHRKIEGRNRPLCILDNRDDLKSNGFLKIWRRR